MGVQEVKDFVNGLTYDQVKTKAAEYSFKVVDFYNLYQISFTDDAKLDSTLARSMNGVIFEKETNRLVHYSFEKAYEAVALAGGVFDPSGSSPVVKDAYTGDFSEEHTVEISTEGSLIKMYYHSGQWNFGTSRSIDASISHWGGKDKSFKELFLECVGYQNIDLETYPKDLCYSWVMQHPNVKVTTDISVPYAGLLSSVNCETGALLSYTETLYQMTTSRL